MHKSGRLYSDAIVSFMFAWSEKTNSIERKKKKAKTSF